MRLNLRQSGAFIGMAGMAVTGFLYVTSGLVAPVWAVLLLCLVWFVLLVMGLRWFADHPLRVLALPFVSLVIWFAALTAGGAFLDWTA